LGAYALANVVLYGALMPLWEGFDEPFHYGYVQQLAAGRGLVDLRDARLTKEVAASFSLAPISPVVKVNLPTAPLYGEYFSWPAARRAQTREALNSIPREWRWADASVLNYEAHHPPLAYVALAIPERLFGRIPLPGRVLLLRWLAAVAGAVMLATGTWALCGELGVAEPFREMVVFCILSLQMTWATIAHVGNDWLAVPLAIWTLVFTIRSAAAPTTRNIALVSVFVSAGLLTKAYFLAIEPLVFVVCALRGRRRALMHCAILAIAAAPWYIRNQALYGTLTGMREARAGLGPSAVLANALRIDWPKVIQDTVRFALWTGNNTFRPFSTKTIDILVLLCTAGLLLWAIGRKRAAEWITALYCALFVLALAYDAVLSHLSTWGVSSIPSPWYAQVIVAPLIALAFLGAARRGCGGRVLAASIAILCGYILAVTYLCRLIPIYSGFDGRGSIRAIVDLYRTRFGKVEEKLGHAALGPPALIFSFTVLALVLILVQEVRFIRRMLPRNLSTRVLPRASASP
jgi:hypothetical protein